MRCGAWWSAYTYSSRLQFDYNITYTLPLRDMDPLSGRQRGSRTTSLVFFIGKRGRVRQVDLNAQCNAVLGPNWEPLFDRIKRP